MRFFTAFGVLAAVMHHAQGAPFAHQPAGSFPLSDHALRPFDMLAESDMFAMKLTDPAAIKTGSNAQESNEPAKESTPSIAKRDVTINMILKWFDNSGITVDGVLRAHGLPASSVPAV